jgi:hypothetical protein
MFQDISLDPYGGRLVWYIYGKPKVGKTSLVLKMLREHKDQYAFFLSADRGTLQVRSDPEPYKGRLAIAYPNTLKEWRMTVRQLKDKVGKVAGKVSPRDLWVVIDTVSAMQIQLLMEGRKIAASKGGKDEKRDKVVEDAEYARDMMVQVDWGINLGLMTEIVNEVMTCPANIMFIALEKNEKDQYDRTSIIPAISGQSGTMLTGIADIICRMVIEGGERKLLCKVKDGSCFAGDRTDKLLDVETPDLYALSRKAIGGTK